MHRTQKILCRKSGLQELEHPLSRICHYRLDLAPENQDWLLPYRRLEEY